MMNNEMSTFLSNVDNVKIRGNKDSVTCTDEIPNTVLSRMLLCQI